MYFMLHVTYLSVFEKGGTVKCRGKDVNMCVLIDSFQQKMTDVLVADHNRSMNVITGEPNAQCILYLQDKLRWTCGRV